MRKITAVSITNRTAALGIRERLSFTKRRTAQILAQIRTVFGGEAVIISTCNRTEFYFTCDASSAELADYVCSLAGGDIRRYLCIYEEEAAVRHLFMITPGLESMVIGEDQILGQVKDAFEMAHESGCTGEYFNTLFRLAVTAAKKIKTVTALSEIPVSVATIAVQACIRELGTLDGKCVLLTGAGGQIGRIILKDIIAVSCPRIYIASGKRSHIYEPEGNAEVIDYDRRYDYIDRADCIISATASPHYIYEADKLRSAVRIDKKRVFMDLAVPADIERYDDESSVFCNIDDLTALAEENNRRKIDEAKKAEVMLEEYIKEFEVRRIYYDNRDTIIRHKDDEDFMRQLYKIKAANDPESFRAFVLSGESV